MTIKTDIWDREEQRLKEKEKKMKYKKHKKKELTTKQILLVVKELKRLKRNFIKDKACIVLPKE